MQRFFKQRLPRQLAAFGLLLALLFTAGLYIPTDQQALARETNYFAPLQDGPSRGQLQLNEPDLTRFYILQDQVLAMNQIHNQTELIKALMRFNREYSNIMAQVSLANFAYYTDTAKYEAIYNQWQELAAEAGQAYENTWRTMLQSDNREMFDSLLPQERIRAMLDTEQTTSEVTEQLNKINSMVSAYWNAMEADYTVEWRGQTYSFDNVNSLPDEDYMEVYLQLVRNRNQAVAAVLVDAVPACNAYARSQGYANYADYTYALNYGRDYTPTDARQLYAIVKEKVVPLYLQVQQYALNNPDFNQQELNALYDFRNQLVVLNTAATYMPEISDEYANALAYLRLKDLLDINYNEKKLHVAFTTYIPHYNLAMIFNGAQSGTVYDFTSFLHEFGHFAYYMYQQEDIAHDVNEFFANGMEMLFLNFADDIFGEQYGDTYRINVVQDLLSGIVQGCLFDEFQQKVYQMEQPTVHDINVLYHDLSVQYGSVYAHEDDEAYNWVTTPHTFIQPFYYISYATSAFSAMELLIRADNDFEQAANKYLEMVANHESYTYRDFFAEAGFADVFNPDELNQLVDKLENYVYREICNIEQIEQVNQHWAKDDLLYAAGLGLLHCDEQGSLQPNAAINRAEAINILWRRFANKSMSVEAANFTDVPAEAWYAEAANWAAAIELISGVDGNRLAGGEPLTREELITMFYRLKKAQTSNAEPAAIDAMTIQSRLASYADQTQISDWAAEPMAWALASGLITGNEQNMLQPKNTATRAEMVTLLSKYLDME